MRRIIYSLILASVLILIGCEKPGEEKIEPTRDGTSWTIIRTYTESMPELSCCAIANNGQFIIAGAARGFFYISTDAGRSWKEDSIIYMDTLGYGIECIDFANENLGILGGKASLFRTTDGGNSWEPKALDIIGTQTITDIEFIDENTVYALTGSKLLVSNDGGATWTEKEINLVSELTVAARRMAFADRNHGIVTTSGEWVFITSDGGNTWNAESLALENPSFTGATAIDQDHYFICGDGGKIMKRTLSEDSTEWKWVEVTTPVTTVLNDIAIVGDEGIAIGDNGVAIITTDGGQTWERTYDLNVFGSMERLDVIPNATPPIFAVAGNDPIRYGGALRIGYGVDNWIPVNFGTAVTLLDLYFFNTNEGIFVGKKAGVYKTYDGGYTLIQRKVPTRYDITLASVSFATADDGVIVGSMGKIFISHDKGETWEEVDTSHITINGDITSLNKVLFVNTNVAYAVGTNGAILKTTDRGENWEQLPNDVNAELFGMYFFDENTGFVIGSGGTILKTTDGGNSWELIDSPTPAALRSIQFTSNNIGWICGDNTILKTTDGGNTWDAYEVIPNIFGYFRDLAFVSNETGWLVGNFGYIIHTADGGETWYRQAEGMTENILYAIFALNENNIWAVGENGIVMKLIPAGMAAK